MPATATFATAATPVAAMAAPTSAAIASCAICGSRHAGDCNLGYCRDPSRCHGSSHSEILLPSPAAEPVGAGMPATATFATAATPVAAMAAPTSAAIASCAICGSRHAGDCNLGYCPDPSRCHGSSHKCCHCQSCKLWEPTCRRLQPWLLPRPESLPWQLPQVLPSPPRQSVGAGMPATATLATAATPVAAMAAPTSAAIATQAVCGSRHAGDCNLGYCRDPSRCHGSSHNK